MSEGNIFPGRKLYYLGMYLGIDIGGTKTLLGVFSKAGQLKKTAKFRTPVAYADFLTVLSQEVAALKQKNITHAAIGVPGRVDRKTGVSVAYGNLTWQKEPIQSDIARIIKGPVLIENDANLAGLSEAKLLKKKTNRVLYLTISTGIGTGIITHGIIDPDFADSEGGQMLIEHDGKLQQWEDFASGKAIEKRFGKQAREINDQKSWKVITHDIALGIIDLIAVLQPEVIVIGGGVGTHFNKFDDLLESELKKYQNPLFTKVILRRAKRSEEAVIYGCYEILKARYG